MRRAVLAAVAVWLLVPSPVAACLNDSTTARSEEEFRSSYGQARIERSATTAVLRFTAVLVIVACAAVTVYAVSRSGERPRVRRTGGSPP